MSKFKSLSGKKKFEPKISNTPDLPAINWSRIGAKAPVPVDPLSKTLFLPAADYVVITWAEAEWAALDQVFCSSKSVMCYSEQYKSYRNGWQKFTAGITSAVSGWDFWCYYTLVKIRGKTTLLIKSNTHLDYPGGSYLEQFIEIIVDNVKPKQIFSIGTAGGSRLEDHIGTINIVNSGTLFIEGQQPSEWPSFENDWDMDPLIISQNGVNELFFPVPTTTDDLESIVEQFNSFYQTNLSLNGLNPSNLNMAYQETMVNSFTTDKKSLLTTSSFVVGTTDGRYKEFAVIEMDDAIIAKVGSKYGIPYGFIRNVSDPVQNEYITCKNQIRWGSAIYSTYGLYTSFNGALTTWAVLYYSTN